MSKVLFNLEYKIFLLNSLKYEGDGYFACKNALGRQYIPQ
jgi:hypothetical protein